MRITDVEPIVLPVDLRQAVVSIGYRRLLQSERSDLREVAARRPLAYDHAMETTQLGASRLEVSRVGLGCNNFGKRLDLAAARAVVDAAVGAGITFFDTADIYGFGDSERFLGDALASRRDLTVIATKFGNDMQGANGEGPGGSREYAHRAIDASLARLGTD